ncbi:MAG: heavy-metal-associated domain-containing protein [Lachnospiraceae bacterium]|nr:heavy-metal-associated domain-containing protein [Lachnospiraceae bacterium]
MGQIIVIAVLILIIVYTVYDTVRRIRGGSSCCGGGEPAEKKIKVGDRNKKNYPYKYILSVEGMHCANCARRVENAFNAGEGRWAIADVGKKEVTLLSKHEETENELREITESSGYTMISVSGVSAGQV